MSSITQNCLIRHYHQSRNKLLGRSDSHSNDLPLSEVLDARQIQRVTDELGITFRERVFTPWVTLWTFLTQVLSADSSCRSAVSRLISWLSVQGKKVCSSATGAYVQARARLPEAFFQRLATEVGGALHERAGESWSFHGRSVKLLDGTLLTLADTLENQQRYLQPKTKRKIPTPGFPMLRLLALISSSTGALLNLMIAPCEGQGTGETSLLYRILKASPANAWIQAGDLLLLDRLFCSYSILASFLERGIDCVVRIHCSMKTEKFQTIRRIAKGDRVVQLLRPRNRPTAEQAQLDELPEEIVLREITHSIHRKGFRPKKIVLLTTLVKPQIYSQAEIADLYWTRWNCELDLRSIKSVMGMDELSCKTPEGVRKEIWTHVLGYNLIRTVMAQSAVLSGVQPRELSFKGALQLMNAFRPYFLPGVRRRSSWEQQYRVLLRTISAQKLLKRPARTEPRAIKRKPSPYSRLRVPRVQARAGYWKKGRAELRRNDLLHEIA